MEVATGHRVRVQSSVGSRFDELNGVGPGFDHLRVGLSLSILIWHSFGISYGIEWTLSSEAVRAIRPLLSALLPMFFALSGFLVMSSAIRIGNLRTFIIFRTLRILPALATEISLSALVVGPLLTVYTLDAYFTDPRFAEYFGSLIGRVRYVLPGLFLNTPMPEVVNGALWTVGPEIFCYIAMSLAILTTIYRHPAGMLLTTGAFLAACLISDAVLPPRVLEILPTKVLIFSFLAGNLVYLFRYMIPFTGFAAGAAVTAAFALLAITQLQGPFIAAMYPAAALLAYITVTIGLLRLPRLPFFWRGDYSYGIYIFGFPIQQTVCQFLPTQREWWSNLAIALPITLICAVASWHLVEKPVLNLRKRFKPSSASEQPQPPSSWRRGQLALAIFLVGYGAFVATASDIFPIERVYRYIVGAKPASSFQPPL